MALERLLIAMAGEGAQQTARQIDNVNAAISRMRLQIQAVETVQRQVASTAAVTLGSMIGQDPQQLAMVARVFLDTQSDLQNRIRSLATASQIGNAKLRVLRAELERQVTPARVLSGAFVALGSSIDRAFTMGRRAVLNFFAVVGLVRMGQMAIEAMNGFLKLGGTVIVTEQQFRAFSGTLGTTSDAFLSKLNKASLDTMSNFDLMRLSNFALNAGLKATEDQIATLVEAAVKMGKVTGRDVTESFQRLTFGIVKQERRILDELGIVVRANDIFKEFAEKNKLVASALTAHQKQQAFLDTVLESVNEKMQAYKDTNFETALAGERISKVFADFKNEIAELIVKSGAADAMLQAVKQVIGELKEKFLGSREGAQSFVSTLVGGFKALINLAVALTRVIMNILPALNVLVDMISKIPTPLITAFLGAMAGGKLGTSIGKIFGPSGALSGGKIGVLIGGVGGLFAGFSGSGDPGAARKNAVTAGFDATRSELIRMENEQARLWRNSVIDRPSVAGLA